MICRSSSSYLWCRVKKPVCLGYAVCMPRLARLMGIFILSILLRCCELPSLALAGSSLKCTTCTNVLPPLGCSTLYGARSACLQQMPAAAGSKGPNHLDERIDAFLAGFEKTLKKLSRDDFEDNRDALIAQKLQKDRSLLDESDRHWEQIEHHRYSSLLLQVYQPEKQYSTCSDVGAAWQLS